MSGSVTEVLGSGLLIEQAMEMVGDRLETKATRMIDIIAVTGTGRSSVHQDDMMSDTQIAQDEKTGAMREGSRTVARGAREADPRRTNEGYIERTRMMSTSGNGGHEGGRN